MRFKRKMWYKCTASAGGQEGEGSFIGRRLEFFHKWGWAQLCFSFHPNLLVCLWSHFFQHVPFDSGEARRKSITTTVEGTPNQCLLTEGQWSHVRNGGKNGLSWEAVSFTPARGLGSQHLGWSQGTTQKTFKGSLAQGPPRPAENFGPCFFLGEGPQLSSDAPQAAHEQRKVQSHWHFFFLSLPLVFRIQGDGADFPVFLSPLLFFRKSKWVRPRSGSSQPSCSSWPAVLCLWQSPPSSSNTLRGGQPWSPFTLWWSPSPRWALVILWQVSTLDYPSHWGPGGEDTDCGQCSSEPPEKMEKQMEKAQHHHCWAQACSKPAVPCEGNSSRLLPWEKASISPPPLRRQAIFIIIWIMSEMNFSLDWILIGFSL